MLILLPPSEGKAAPRVGRPLDLDKLSLPGLTGARERALDTLAEMCRADPDGALAALGLAAGQRADVERNVRLRAAPAIPAGRLYTGVLYDALDLATLDAAARRAATRSLLIFSGLWGAVRVGDRLPAYRCAVGARLPGLGGLGAYWRKAMTGAVEEAAGGGVVVDLRSSGYAGMWAPAGGLAVRTAVVSVWHQRVEAGVITRSVVSHFNKATKGRLVRALLAGGVRARTPKQLVEALRALEYTVEWEPSRDGPQRVHVVVEHL